MPGQIKIASMRHGLQPELGFVDLPVDRGSPLGNPFWLQDTNNDDERECVCDLYEMWLDKMLAGEADDPEHFTRLAQAFSIKIATDRRTPFPAAEKVLAALNRIVEMVRSGQNVRLLCWCFPKRCHAMKIKQEVEARV